ncbi:MAG: TetR/AcrR family transcriptional regulator [Acidobacteria bacterium]|nr:MAG: TetR/AcrR family transcriptional regulator [Acidobacteriota bacterium]REJ99433.1 MAG: TetR/AcrR family transcriptional regulator [Acidobacteriota bacterium]
MSDVIGQESQEERPYHHGDLRRALLEATRELLMEGGVQAASLRAVARRAGVTNRAPYHHFPDKCSLLAAVATEGFRKLRENVARRLEHAGSDPVARLTEIGLGYIEFAHQNPGEFQVMFWHEVCDAEEHPERDTASECCFMQLLETIQSMARRPIGEHELKSLGVTAWSAVHGFATLRAQDSFVDERVDDLAEALARRIAVVTALEVGAFSLVPAVSDSVS